MSWGTRSTLSKVIPDDQDGGATNPAALPVSAKTPPRGAVGRIVRPGWCGGNRVRYESAPEDGQCNDAGGWVPDASHNMALPLEPNRLAIRSMLISLPPKTASQPRGIALPSADCEGASHRRVSAGSPSKRPKSSEIVFAPWTSRSDSTVLTRSRQSWHPRVRAGGGSRSPCAKRHRRGPSGGNAGAVCDLGQ